MAIWAGLGLVYAVIVVSRRPDALLHPQFYAEDGQAWYADAHNLPALQALLLPLAGYYQLFQRLVAFVLTPVGLAMTPLAYALVAFAVQTLPALVFASGRLRTVVRDDRTRWLIGGVYLLIPNLELAGNLTNTQWHLAVLAFVLLLATPPRSTAARAFDIAALIFAGLSGPYAFFLVPLGVLMHRRELRLGWRRVQLAVLGVAGLIECAVMVLSGVSRPHGALGVSLQDVPLIFANQFLARIGEWGFSRNAVAPALLVTLFIILVLVAGFRRGPSALRYFIVFAFAIAATGLLAPYGRLLGNRPAWDLIATGGMDNRYFFMFSVAVIFAGVAVIVTWRPRLRVAGFGAAAAVLFVIPSAIGQWQYIAIPSENLQHYEAVLNQAPPGTVVTIPIYPQNWTMQLMARR